MKPICASIVLGLLLAAPAIAAPSNKTAPLSAFHVPAGYTQLVSAPLRLWSVWRLWLRLSAGRRA